MNNKLTLTVIVLSGFLYHLNAQVAIGKDSVDGDALIDFEQSDKGIILPTNNSLNDEVGSIAFLRTDGKIYYIDTNQEYQPLTGFSPVELANIKPEELSENVDEAQGVLIGSDNSTANGVLILESLNKALVLPKVNNVENSVINPEPGTICYDLASKSIALFDGTNWYFWNHLKSRN